MFLFFLHHQPHHSLDCRSTVVRPSFDRRVTPDGVSEIWAPFLCIWLLLLFRFLLFLKPYLYSVHIVYRLAGRFAGGAVCGGGRGRDGKECRLYRRAKRVDRFGLHSQTCGRLIYIKKQDTRKISCQAKRKENRWSL